MVQRQVSLSELCDILSANSRKRFLITFHSMGDRDAVSSAIVLSKFLRNSVVATPDFITSNARQILLKAGFTGKIENEFPNDADGVIIVDANTLEATNKFEPQIRSSRGMLIFIDHHAIHKASDKDCVIFNDEGYNSTASIVYELLKEIGTEVDKQAALLLINGIVADSADFQNITPMSFRQIAALLDVLKIDYTQAVVPSEEHVSAENRMKVIKDISDAKVERVGEYLIISGRSNVHANILAESAIKLGADAAVFWTENTTEVSISARLRPPLDRTFKIHLGFSMQRLAPIIEGTGGGHPCAAGAYGPAKQNTERFMNEIVAEIKSKLSK